MNESTAIHRVNPGLTRRGILGAGGATLVSTVAVGCDMLSTEPTGGEGSAGDSESKGRQAPDLAERVEAGDLPPLDERLPTNPVVVEPSEEIGRYGGTWRSALLGPTDLPWLNSLLLERMVRWPPDMSEVFPNVVEDFDVNGDGTEYTFTLREGLRWSDGQPFTVDDIVFAQNDVYNNAELEPVRPDPPRRAEKVDDRTVMVLFEEPDPLYLLENRADGLLNKPLHYLRDFHADYNDDVDDLVADEGVEDWVELFQRKGGTIEGTPYNAVWQNAELPRLHPWVPVVPLGESNRLVFERNPYYWKVDPDGSQLPYIDRLVINVNSEIEVILLQAMQGEIDMTFRHINTPANKPALAQEREAGGFRFFDAQPAIMNETLLILNLTHQDPVKREIFNNRDFRIGLSHAINREEISAVAFQQQGEPWQAAPRRESPLFDEEFAKQYTEYDLDLANEYLDRAGYDERNGDGIRLGPDGEPITFTVEFSRGSRAEPVDTLELVEQYWQDVGIGARVNFVDRALLANRNEANEYDAFAWEGDGGMTPIVVPDWYFPVPAYLTFARLWSEWYGSDGEEGEQPPEAARQQMDLYDQVNQTTDADEQNRILGEILRIAKEEFWVIGTILATPSYGIAKNNFRNIPGPIMDPAQIPPMIDACQCFIEE